MYLISRALQGTRNRCHHPAMGKKEVKGKASLAENTKNYTPEKMDVYD